MATGERDGTILGEIEAWSLGDYAGVKPSRVLSLHAMNALAKRLREREAEALRTARREGAEAMRERAANEASRVTDQSDRRMVVARIRALLAESPA